MVNDSTLLHRLNMVNDSTSLHRLIIHVISSKVFFSFFLKVHSPNRLVHLKIACSELYDMPITIKRNASFFTNRTSSFGPTKTS